MFPYDGPIDPWTVSPVGFRWFLMYRDGEPDSFNTAPTGTAAEERSIFFMGTIQPGLWRAVWLPAAPRRDIAKVEERIGLPAGTMGGA